MLQVHDDGTVTIALSGGASAVNLYVLIQLVAVALLVVWVVFTFWGIVFASLACVVSLCVVCGYYWQQSASTISSGKIFVQTAMFSHGACKYRVTTSKKELVSLLNQHKQTPLTRVVLQTDKGERVVTGFANQQSVIVFLSRLQGTTIKTNKKEVRLQSS